MRLAIRVAILQIMESSIGWVCFWHILHDILNENLLPPADEEPLCENLETFLLKTSKHPNKIKIPAFR
jgi:hypothetical protein